MEYEDRGYDSINSTKNLNHSYFNCAHFRKLLVWKLHQFKEKKSMKIINGDIQGSKLKL